MYESNCEYCCDENEICDYCGEYNLMIPIKQTKYMFDPVKQFGRWLDRILGVEPRKELEPFLEHIDDFKRLVNLYKIKNLNVTNIRKLLKQLNLQSFYKNITSIAVIVSGIEMFHIEDDQKEYCIYIFNKVIYPQISSKSIFYPYYIYKILEYVLTPEQNKIISKYIYLQSSITFYKNEQIWNSMKNLESIKSIICDGNIFKKT